MKHLWMLAKIIGVLLAVGHTVVSWTEVEKEIRVLCSRVAPGRPLSRVVETLDTGEDLHYRAPSAGKGEDLRFSTL